MSNRRDDLSTEEMIKYFKKTGSLKKTSKKFNCVSSTVIARMKKAGFNYRPYLKQKFHKTDIDINSLIETIKEIGSVKKTADEFEVSPSTVRYHLKKAEFNYKPYLKNKKYFKRTKLKLNNVRWETDKKELKRRKKILHKNKLALLEFVLDIIDGLTAKRS